MNRRRFLSMFGAIPAVLALPSLPALAATKRTGATIVVQSAMNDFRADLQRLAEIGVTPGPRGSDQLVLAHGGEMILPAPKPPKPRTVAERATARELAEAVIRVEHAYIALAGSPIGIELLAAEDALEALMPRRRKS